MPSDNSVDPLISHRLVLVRYARPIVGDVASAEDVVQEAYLRYLRPRRQGDGTAIEQPLSYLYRIVRNLALDFVRQRRTEAREEEAGPWWMLPAASPDPEAAAAHRERVARVEAALAAMDDRMRVAIEMHQFEGHGLQAVANRLGVSVATSHRLVRQALVRLASAIAEDAGG